MCYPVHANLTEWLERASRSSSSTGSGSTSGDQRKTIAMNVAPASRVMVIFDLTLGCANGGRQEDHRSKSASASAAALHVACLPPCVSFAGASARSNSKFCRSLGEAKMPSPNSSNRLPPCTSTGGTAAAAGLFRLTAAACC